MSTHGLYVSQRSLDRERAKNYLLRAAAALIDGADDVAIGTALAYAGAAVVTIAALDDEAQGGRKVALEIVRLAGERARGTDGSP